MRFWWVNHKQTARQELTGGFLWSPKTEARGTRSQFYDNMRRAAPGDIVLSYAAGRVGRVGIVTDFALEAQKPTEFKSAGSYWHTVGWLLPVAWFEASLSVRPKDLLDRLAPVLPRTHSPIQPATGNGNQKAYLAEVDRSVIEVVLEAGGLRLPDFIDPAVIPPASDFQSALDDVVENAILHDTSIDETTRKQLTDARRGQGVFRRRVLQVEPVCRVAGIKKPTLLRVSHIKPWRACDTAHERLDGFNGLMLAPHVDFLFDRRLIGFEDVGRALFSSQLTEGRRSKARASSGGATSSTPVPP
jgi:putative restriction endonuclease